MKIAYSGSAGQYVNVETGEPVGDGEQLDIGTTWWGCGEAHPESEDCEHCGVSGCHGVPVPDAPYAHLSDPAERTWLTNVSPSDVLANAHRIYDFMREQGIPPDSYTRELAFEKASTALGVPYDDIDDAWLNEDPLDFCERCKGPHSDLLCERCHGFRGECPCGAM